MQLAFFLTPVRVTEAHSCANELGCEMWFEVTSEAMETLPQVPSGTAPVISGKDSRTLAPMQLDQGQASEKIMGVCPCCFPGEHGALRKEIGQGVI